VEEPAGAPGEDDVPVVVADVVVVVVVEDDAVAVIVGKLTAPDDPVVNVLPAMLGAVVAVCAAAPAVSAISSKKPRARL
jgi:hypothetical protein